MKKVFSVVTLIVTLLIAFAILTAPVYGQSSSVSVTIPFEFTVSNVTLPAGEYLFSPTSTPRVLAIKDARTKHLETFAVLAVMNGSMSWQAVSDVEFTFNKYGERHFLAGASGSGEYWGFAKSPSEKALVRSRVLYSEVTIRPSPDMGSAQ